jgi:capsular exopolysaccharide synthesis family protein
MRRAAERVDTPEPPVDAEPSAGIGAAGAPDPIELAGEHYPIEMRERRHHPRDVASHWSRQSLGPPPSTPVESAVERKQSPASVPLLERIDGSLAQKIVIDQSMMATSREQYRRLAATLHHAQTATGLKVIMIASAAPAEGKTLTAANLALTFSESYRRNVLLIDADLRRPALHTIFGTDNASGLTEGLTAPTERRLPVRAITERLGLLQAGRPSSDPMAGLTSDRMRRLIVEARESFDWIVIDSPPVGLLPDANLLAAMVDGVVMVVKAGATSYELVNRAIEMVGRARILGVVLNRAEVAPYGYGYDYYNGYYGTGGTERLSV